MERDNYGREKTPLFADGLHSETLQPPREKRADKRTYDHLVFYGSP